MFFPLVLVVISLLINLGSPIKEVRRAAIHCLQALSGVASQFQLVIDHVVPKAEEITSDATAFSNQPSQAQPPPRTDSLPYRVAFYLGGT